LFELEDDFEEVKMNSRRKKRLFELNEK